MAALYARRMPVSEWIYVAAQRGLGALEPLLRPSGSKLARGVRARRDALDPIIGWGAMRRDARRPTVWFHAPSFGEALQAQAVVDALREPRPDLQFALTWFSPSAESVAPVLEVDVAGTLPWDVPTAMSPALDALSPSLLVFTRSEVWPVLSRIAERREVPLALVAASVRRGSTRLRAPTRRLLGPTWRRLSLAAAVSADDGHRLRALGVAERAVHVTGDPRVDSVAARVARVDPAAPWITPFRADPAPTLVAGSTWSPDEAVLLPAIARVRAQLPELRAIVAPHEPDERTVADLRARLDSDGWSVSTLGEVERAGSARGANAVVVDRVGVLADLYTVAGAAYVGGGFHSAGLHSVLEPAAAGVPVAFGPSHGGQPAADDLMGRGAGRVVRGVPDLAEALLEWLSRRNARERARASALSYIEAHRGAADRTARLLRDLLPT